MGVFSLDLELLGRETQTPAAQAIFKSMLVSLQNSILAFEQLDFYLENGHHSPSEQSR
jgi:hypothetical protein